MKILTLHPELSPFVGKFYGVSPCKVLFVGESHYLPAEYNHIVGQEWYAKSTAQYGFSQQALAFLNTATIIRNDVINSTFKNNSHSIYRNIGDVYGAVFDKGNYTTALEYVAFSNYFLRPAEECGGSIQLNNWEEEMFSYEHLWALSEQLRPKIIVFASKKAYQSFCRVHEQESNKNRFASVRIAFVPHPATSWWHRPISE